MSPSPAESGIPASSGASDIPEGRLLAPGAVARLFGVDPRTVTRWVDKGMLLPIMTPGGHRRYRYLDVMSLRDRLTTGAGQPASTPPSSGSAIMSTTSTHLSQASDDITISVVASGSVSTSAMPGTPVAQGVAPTEAAPDAHAAAVGDVPSQEPSTDWRPDAGDPRADAPRP